MGQEGIEHLTSRLGTATGVAPHEMADAIDGRAARPGRSSAAGCAAPRPPARRCSGLRKPWNCPRTRPTKRGAFLPLPAGTEAGPGGGVHDGTTPEASTGRVPVTENIARGRAAVNEVLSTRSSVPGAMVRDDVGEITFDYGTPGTPGKRYREGFGFSHIVARRNLEGGRRRAVRPRGPPRDTCSWQAMAHPRPPNGRRAEIVYRGDMAVLSLYRHEDRETWVLSGYKLFAR